MRGEHFDLIHVHMPLGGVLGRIAAALTHSRPVLYTAHGFSFCESQKGKGLGNILYRWIEQVAARVTDCMIVMNNEDYAFARNHMKLRKNGMVRKIHGVGIVSERFEAEGLERADLRQKLDIPEKSCVLITVGELIERKNMAVLLDAVSKISDKECLLMICGTGVLYDALVKRAEELDLGTKVRFLGYRNDVINLLKASDIFVFASHKEGLPVCVMEAMAGALPCVVSDIRGNNDLVDDGLGGYLAGEEDPEEFAVRITRLIRDGALRKKFGLYNREKINGYDISVVEREMRNIYEYYLEIRQGDR